MAGRIHHAAVNTKNFEKTVAFFEEVFGMTAARSRGEAPKRQLWFHEGIQVNEVTQICLNGNIYDHIGMQVDDIEQTIQKARAMGCKAIDGKPAHWLITEDNIILELK